MRGGNIPYNFFRAFDLESGRSLNFFGSNITATYYFSIYQDYTEYLLTGVLSDGSTLNGNRLIIPYSPLGDYGKLTITNIPEPGSVALLIGFTTVGAGVLRRKRRW